MTTSMGNKCRLDTSSIPIRLSIPVTMKVRAYFVSQISPQLNDSVTVDSIFSGITTFAKLPWVQCLSKDRDTAFDIAFVGAPFVSPGLRLHYRLD